MASAFAEHTRRISDASAARWARFETLLSQGWTIKAACQEIGVSRKAYEQKRSRDPAWKHRVDTLLHRIRREDDPHAAWDGSTADFALRYVPPPPDAGVDWPGQPYHYSVYQHAVTDALDSCPEGGIVMVNLPPGGRKTTTLENWIIQRTSLDPNHRTLLISETVGHVRQSIGRIKQILSDPELATDLIARYGPYYVDGQEKQGKPWASDRITVAKRTGALRDYSIRGFGINTQIYGARGDTIIVDDPQTLKTLSLTETLAKRFRLEILSRRPRAGKGRVVIIGTRLDSGDFYEWVADNIDLHAHVELKAVDADGAPVDAEVFPPDEVDRVRAQVGPEAFASAYQQRPLAGDHATFTLDLLGRGKRADVKVGERPESAGVVTGLDPNLGAGVTAVVTCAYTQAWFRPIDLVERHRLARTEDIFDLLETQVARYRPTDVAIEIDAFQRGLARDDRLQRMARRYGFRTVEHTTSGKKDDPDIGFARMASSFIRGEFQIPWGDADTERKFQVLCDELAAWRPGMRGSKLKHDASMACWFAWILWQKRRPSQAGQSVWRTKGWRPPITIPRSPVKTPVRGAA